MCVRKVSLLLAFCTTTFWSNYIPRYTTEPGNSSITHPNIHAPRLPSELNDIWTEVEKFEAE